jgi:hypothetical protein
MTKSSTSALILFLAASDAAADELVLQRFTQSMSDLYETALLCEYALSPSPAGYARAISDYVQTYYPDVVSPYWALPVVNRRAQDSSYCSTRLQQNLMHYATARNDFAEAYEDHPLPPQLAMVYEAPVRVTVVRRSATTGTPTAERFHNATSGGY